MGSYDRLILASICGGDYTDWSDNKRALTACHRLAAKGFCRVVWEDVACWRVYQSAEQLARGMKLLTQRHSNIGWVWYWLKRIFA